MRKKAQVKAVLLFYFSLFFFLPNKSFCDSIEPLLQTRQPVSYLPGQGITIQPIDLTVKLAGTFIFQDVSNPNQIVTSKSGNSWVGYLDFTKKFGESGLVFLRFQSGRGNSVGSKLGLLTGVNYNALNNGARVEARQFWYKQSLLDKQFSFTVGKIQSRNYLDKSEYAGDDDAQFLANIFNKSYAIEWPAKFGFGINLNLCPQPVDFLELGFNYFDAAAKWSELGSNNMYSLELKLKTPPFFGSQDKRWGGNYRVFSWLNTRKHNMLLKPDETKDANYGFGFGFDQRVADVFGVFGRVGWQRPDLVPSDGGTAIEFTWSAGTQVTGEYWGRKKDVLGLAAGQVFPGDEYNKAGHPAAGEGHLELYYNLALNEYIHISPDFQLAWNPNGVSKKSGGDNDTIFISGVRVRMDF